MIEPAANTTNATKGIGRIQRVALNEVWRHEALDFTTWLEKNIEVLADATGLQLNAVEREQSVGAFSVDLIAQDQDGRAVVIENQLKKSDHDHLGKLLTYLVGLEAPQAVWIVADPRPEHVRVISWLNESSPADFYLLKLEAIQIGDSKRAPLLTQIVGPSEETRAMGETKTILVERQRLRLRFFEGLLEHAKSKTPLHANISPSIHNWIGAGSGIAGITFNYVVLEHEARVELYIDTKDDVENQRMFKALFSKKERIEKEFGGTLEWDTKDGRRSCRIQKAFTTGGCRDENKWETVYEEAAEAMAGLESALKDHLQSIKSS